MGYLGCRVAKPSYGVKRIVLISTLLSLAACGGSGSDVAPLGGGLAAGEVRELTFDSNNQAQIIFSELSGSEEFGFLFFAANVNEGNFNISLHGLSDLPEAKYLKPSSAGANEDDSDTTSAFHEKLREAENEMVGQAAFQGDDSMTNKALGFNPPSCGSGGIQIKVLNSLSSNTSYTATCAILARQTGTALYYIDQEALSVLTQNLLNPVVDDFEAKISTLRSILGRESDVDGSGHFTVYLTPAVNRLGAAQGGVVTAFFFGVDLFPAQANPASNEREILYISVPDPDGTWGTPVSQDFWASNIGATVIQHEFQHMVSFNHKVLEQGVETEQAWANEGLSHFIEDLNLGSHLGLVGPENPSRVAAYLSQPEKSPFTAGTSIYQRGGAYLFFRYLYEQADSGRFPKVRSGDEMLSVLLRSSQRGVENIEEATGMNFKDLLLGFYATLQLSNRGITSNPQFNFQGINLMGPQADNRGTVLQGVTSYELASIPTDGSVSSPGGLFYNAFGQTIKNAGQALTFIGAPGMNPGGAVIRLK